MALRSLLFACASVCVLGSSAYAASAVPNAVTAAVNDPGRPPGDKERDADRHPAELVAFAGIKPGDKVADFIPGGGYYTRIFAKLVGPKGKVYALAAMPAVARDVETLNEQNAERVKAGQKPIERPIDPILAIQNIAEYSNVSAMMEMLTQYKGQFSLPEQVDVVWTSDNYHDLHTPFFGSADFVPTIDKNIYASLKNGGAFVVVDHASAPSTGFTTAKTLHRSDKDAVKAEVLSAGFVFDGESNVLANPADDHTKTAFQMHDKTDQYAFRFKKPMNAAKTDQRPPKNAFDGYYGNTNIMNMDSPEKTGPHQERRMIYHADGTYQEFGWGDMQAGTWYWDAAGHNCMLHESPLSQRGFVVCHSSEPFKKAGDKWGQEQVVGDTAVPPTPFTIISGYHPIYDPSLPPRAGQ